MSSKIQLNYIRDFELCDRNHFKILKGISILAALISYICGKLLNVSYLEPVQGIATAVFLFCSGYGVSESHERKGGLIHFWENKAIKVWLPSLVVMVVMSLIVSSNMIVWIAQSPLGLKGNLLYLLFGAYGVFWLLFYFLDNKATRCAGLFTAAAVAFFLVPDINLAAVLLCFPTGVLFSQYGFKYKVRAIGLPGKLALCAVSLIAAAAGWVLGVMTEVPYLETFFWTLTYLFGALFLLISVYTAKKIPVFGVFVPFGYMAYGLYLLYDYILALLYRAEDAQSLAFALAVLLVVAGLFSWLRELLIVLNKNARRRKGTHLKGSMW